jgi:hypothetical protein
MNNTLTVVGSGYITLLQQVAVFQVIEYKTKGFKNTNHHVLMFGKSLR